MALLYFIRHPHTQVNLSLPVTCWGLSDTGRAQTNALLRAPFWLHISTIYCSREEKAILPAKEAALHHNLTVIPRSGLGEVNRSTYTAPDQAAYEVAVQAFFTHPEESPCGWETAADALARFRSTLAQILAAHPDDESLAIVSHGLVLALFMAHLAGENPTIQRWKAMDFCTVAAVDRTAMTPLTGFLAAPYPAIPLP